MGSAGGAESAYGDGIFCHGVIVNSYRHSVVYNVSLPAGKKSIFTHEAVFITDSGCPVCLLIGYVITSYEGRSGSFIFVVRSDRYPVFVCGSGVPSDGYRILTCRSIVVPVCPVRICTVVRFYREVVHATFSGVGIQVGYVLFNRRNLVGILFDFGI